MFLSNSSNLATDLHVFRDTGSQCVAVRLLAYTFLEQDAVDSSGAGGCSKTVPGEPDKFRASGCGQESRQGVPKGLGFFLKKKKVTGNVGYPRAACCLTNVEIPGIVQRSSLYLVIPEFEP